MLKQSQRDKKWGNVKLGFSNVLIRDYGCVITALANMFDTTPLVINDYLKKNGGYVNGNLVYWAKVPGFIYRGWSYNNDKVKEAIKKYGACIVQTDFDGNPRTNGDHYVVFTGNHKLIDPWDGKEKPTSAYPLLKGYVVYDIKEAKKVFHQEDKKNELQACLEAHRKAVEAADRKDREIKKLQDEIKKYEDDRAVLKHKISDLENLVKNFRQAEKDYKKQLNSQQDEINRLRKDKNGLEKKMELLQNDIKTRLAKKDLDCQDKLKDQETRMVKDFELKENQYKNKIKELEEQVKKKEIVKKVEPAYKTLRDKLIATIKIWF